MQAITCVLVAQVSPPFAQRLLRCRPTSPANWLRNRCTVMTEIHIPKPKSLAWWETYFEGEIKASALRAEVNAGRLKAFRSRPGCSGKILIDEDAMQAWLRDHAGKRQKALSPREAKRVNDRPTG